MPKLKEKFRLVTRQDTIDMVYVIAKTTDDFVLSVPEQLLTTSKKTARLVRLAATLRDNCIQALSDPRSKLTLESLRYPSDIQAQRVDFNNIASAADKLFIELSRLPSASDLAGLDKDIPTVYLEPFEKPRSLKTLSNLAKAMRDRCLKAASKENRGTITIGDIRDPFDD